MMTKEECLLTFSSTHAAISAEACLAKQDFMVRVMAKPDSLGAGCGLCLRVDTVNKATACMALEKEKVPIDQIYLIKRDKGYTEYLPWTD